MNKISGTKNRTVVKIFISTLTSAIFLWHSTGRTQGNDKKATPAIPPDSAGAVLLTHQLAADERKAQACTDERNKILEAEKEIGEACKRAGLGDAAGCIAKAESCAETSGTESFDTLSMFSSALGLPAGSGSADVSTACPQMNGRDYFTEKDKLEREIKDTEKELAELSNDRADIEEDFNKEMKDIQETLTKAQEEFKKKKLEIAKENRDRVAEFMNTQNQAKEELRKRGADILRLRGQLIQSHRDKALKLLAMTEAAGNRACMKAVADAKKSYDSVSSSKSDSHIRQAKRKREDLINIFNDCMSSFDQQRIALNESKRQEQEELTNQINSAQSSMDEIQNTLNLADTQLKEMNAASKQEETDALQSVTDLSNQSKVQMDAASQKMKTKLQTLAQKTQSLQAALNRTNQSLKTLGPAPKRNVEDTADQASSTISAQVNIIKDIQNSSKCDDVKDLAKKSYNSLTKGKGAK